MDFERKDSMLMLIKTRIIWIRSCFSTCISLAVMNMVWNSAWICREVFGFIIERESYSRKNKLVVKLVYNAIILSYHGSRNCALLFIETSFESKAAFISSICGGYNRYGSWINGSEINVSHNAHNAFPSRQMWASRNRECSTWRARKKRRKENTNRSFLYRREKMVFPLKFSRAQICGVARSISCDSSRLIH